MHETWLVHMWNETSWDVTRSYMWHRLLLLHKKYSSNFAGSSISSNLTVVYTLRFATDAVNTAISCNANVPLAHTCDTNIQLRLMSTTDSTRLALFALPMVTVCTACSCSADVTTHLHLRETWLIHMSNNCLAHVTCLIDTCDKTHSYTSSVGTPLSFDSANSSDKCSESLQWSSKSLLF